MSVEADLFYRFGIALVIGILIGLQREYTYDAEEKPEEKQAAGVRTFALLSLAGCTGAYLSDLTQSIWPLVGVLLAVLVLVAIAYYITALQGSVGFTTEVAAIVATLIGALAYEEQLIIAAALGVTTTALLSFKLELHGFVRRLTREDIVATIKFAIITLIILPVFPNEALWDQPPLDVVNPYKIWLMVVLISGISFLGYVLFKLLGSQRGIGLTGFLGGLASSTAVTLSFAQRSQKDNELAKPFALAITIAWTVMFARVLIEVAAVHPPLLRTLWLPIVAGGGAGLAYGLYLHFGPQGEDDEDVDVSNPFELRPAITFGLLYGVILVLSRAAQFYFDDTGLYLSSLASGLADVDAITLSVAELTRNGNLDFTTAARAIVLAAMSNTVVKGGIVLSSGSAALRRALLPGFILIVVTAVSLAFLAI